MSGYVYLIGNQRFHWFKIGKSKNAQVRVEHLGVLLPFKLKVIGIWKAQNHTLMESAMHEQYAASRINGEWFSFSDKKLEEIYFSIPLETSVYWHKNPTHQDLNFASFSNIERDILSTKPKCAHTTIIQLAAQKSPTSSSS